MPRTNLTVLEIGRVTALQDPTQHTPDVANGNSFDNSSNKVFLRIVNGSGGAAVCTVDYPGSVDTDLTIPNRTYTVPAGEVWYVGPFPSTYNQTDNSLTNRVLFNFDVSTSITVEVLKLPAA